MNELVAISSFVVLAILVLVAAQLGRTALFVLSVTFIILSNFTVQLPVRVFWVEISWAIIIYSLVYFITDLLCEYHGRAMGYRLAATNLAVQIILWAYVWASLQVTPIDSAREVYATMERLFATTAQITFAAVIAAAGPFLDIYIFSWVRRKWDAAAERHSEEDIYTDAVTGGETSTTSLRQRVEALRRLYRRLLAVFFRNRLLALVARNKLSTFAGQIVNTIIFFSLALLDTGTPIETVFSIILSAIVVKLATAVADIPFLIMAEKYLQLQRTAT